MFGYFNGHFYLENESSIPLNDRGFLFGDGVFSTICIENGIPLFLEKQIEKLRNQCFSINILPPKISKQLITSIIEKNKAYTKSYSMKIIVTGGSSPKKNLTPRKGSIAILLQKFSNPPKKLSMGIFPFPFHLCHSHYKSLANLNRLYVANYAKNNNYDDAITCTYNKILLEASFGNIFWIIDKEIFTPNPKNLPLYFGITIKHLLDTLKQQGYSIHFVEQNYLNFSENAMLFRTSSLSGIVPVSKLNNINLKISSKITNYLQETYKKLKDNYKATYSI